MGRWLSLARVESDEKNAKTPVCDTPKTPKTSPDRVLGVLGVSDLGVSEKFTEPTKLRAGGFGGKPKGAFSENFPAPATAPEPDTRPSVVAVEAPEAAVASRLDAMAAENAKRRDWWTKPVDGWRDGRLTIRSALTGEETTVYLPRGRTLH